MSMYSAAAAGQGLYEASTSRKVVLGTVHHFSDGTNGIVTARYMSNAATDSIAAGALVKYGHGVGGGVIGGAMATNDPAVFLAGGLAASVAATGGYAWVIFRGIQTNASATATLASSAADRVLEHNGAGIGTAAASYATGAAGQALLVGILPNAGALAAAASNTITWLWK